MIKMSMFARAGWLASLLILSSGCAFDPADDCAGEDCAWDADAWEADASAGDSHDQALNDQGLADPGYTHDLDEEIVPLPGADHGVEATLAADSSERDDEQNPDPQPWAFANENPDPQPWEGHGTSEGDEGDEGDNPDPQPWKYGIAQRHNPDPQPWQPPPKASAYGTPDGHDQEPDPQPW